MNLRTALYCIYNKPAPTQETFVHIDWLDEHGFSDLAVELRAACNTAHPHKWEDVSYHGGPHYQCDYCHADQGRCGETCEKALPHVISDIAGRELKDLGEYEDMLRAEVRRRALIQKFGGFESDL